MLGKILVIRGGAIGDFVLTLPAITALRNRFPEAHLELLGYPHIAQLAYAAELVDRVHGIEARGLAGFFARNGELREDLADYFSEFDLILSYLYDPDAIFQSNIGRCTTAQYIAGPHRADDAGSVPAARVFLKPLERLAIFDADPVPRLSLKPEPRSAPTPDQGESIVGPLALHPGSGSERKNWEESNWAGLLQELVQTTSAQLLLVGGEAEGGRLQRLAAPLPPERVRLAQSLSLVELGQLLQPCRAFIGHDSGITHLAAALGLPGLVLWGNTIAEVWRPPSEKMVLLNHPRGLDHIEINEVLDALGNIGRLDSACIPNG